MARITEKINRSLVGGPEESRPFERPRCRWGINIKMDIKELGCGDVCRIYVAAGM